MKYGCNCKCGWGLSRGKLTRKHYAAAKREHARPTDKAKEGCEALAKQLALTDKDALAQSGVR